MVFTLSSPPQQPSDQVSEAVAQAAHAATHAAAQAQMRGDAARMQAELARAQAELARARLEGQFGQPGILIDSRASRDANVRREENMVFGGLMAGLVVAMGVLYPIARAFGRRLERGKESAPPGVDTAAQLQRIEHAVEAIAVEIERLSEGQRFTTKLLASRADAESLIPRS
jgi:hypothetical protein